MEPGSGQVGKPKITALPAVMRQRSDTTAYVPVYSSPSDTRKKRMRAVIFKAQVEDARRTFHCRSLLLSFGSVLNYYT